MPRLFWRLFFSFWLTMVLFAGLMGALSDSLARRAGPGPMQEHVNELAASHARSTARLLQQQGPQAARNYIEQLPRRLRSFVFVIGPDGRELAGRDQFLERMKRHGPAHLRDSRQVRGADGQTYRLLLAPRLPPRVLLSQDPIGTLARLLLAALASAVVSWFLARSLAQPLARLRSTSQALASGKLGARAGADLSGRRDEIGLLARDFDAMAEQLEALDRGRRQLLRDVSHELRSPLARIGVALELAQDKQREAGLQDSAELRRIGQEAGRLNELIGQVLGLMRDQGRPAGQSLDEETLDLAELVRRQVDAARFEAQGRLEIDVQAPASLPVRAEREALTRALDNLLRNALHYSPDGGRIEVRLDNSIALSVRDQGPGVPEADLDQLFDPFFRVSQARERASGGYGLGLAIVDAAARRHGGGVRAENAPQGGLKVTLQLPPSRIEDQAET